MILSSNIYVCAFPSTIKPRAEYLTISCPNYNSITQYWIGSGLNTDLRTDWISFEIDGTELHILVKTENWIK